jgi:hypothetical protein
MADSGKWWDDWHGPELAQGDLVLDCPVLTFLANETGKEQLSAGDTPQVGFELFNCVVMTQSCDLENGKAPSVALCPVYTLDEYAEFVPHYRRRGNWEQVRRGQVEGLHLLASPTNPTDNMSALVVSFRTIHSLPFDLVSQRAVAMGDRWRLKSPYLEHLSQAFARFFMRVGLPAGIPTYKK